MLTFHQKIHGMFTIQELYEIEDKILNGITEKELRRIFVGRKVYVSEGTVGDIPIQELPIPYKNFVDEILSIKSKDTLMYAGNTSLFRLEVGKHKSKSLYHHTFKIVPTPYLDFTDNVVNPKEMKV